MPLWDQAVVWWVVGDLRGNVGVAASSQKLPGAPPLGEGLQAAWHVAWKWRRLESLEDIELITHRTILCHHYPQLPNMACKAGGNLHPASLSCPSRHAALPPVRASSCSLHGHNLSCLGLRVNRSFFVSFHSLHLAPSSSPCGFQLRCHPFRKLP